MVTASGLLRLVPTGWRLAPAILAGLLWSGALALASRLPPVVAEARALARQSPPEPIGWAQVFFALVPVLLLLALAHGLSLAGHGGRDAPRPVRVARATTWLAATVLVLFLAWLESHPRSCVLGCGPLLG